MFTLYLKEFIDLYETCNYTETAENMNISTSSLSKHISKLEEECRVPLFDRTTRTVVPNEYGALFVEYAKQIVDLEEKGIAALATLVQKNSGVLTVGYMPVMLEYGLMDLLLDFMQRYPDIEIKTCAGNRCSEMFEVNKCNFVFFDDYSQSDLNLNHLLCMEDRLVVLLPPGHPLSRRKKIPVDLLRNERVITHGVSPTALNRDSKLFCELCQEAGFTPDIHHSFSHISTIIRMVQKGAGISVLNRLQCPAALAANVAVVDLEPASPFYIYCLSKKDVKFSSKEKLFLSFIQENSGKWPVQEYGGAPSSHRRSR